MDGATEDKGRPRLTPVPRTAGWKPIGEHLPQQLKSPIRPQRRLLAPVGQERDEGIVFQHSVLCHTALPYRDPGAQVRRWQARNGYLSLEVEAGRVFDGRRGEFLDVGLPFGPKPRLVLCHLNAEALRTGSPLIDLEDTLTAFVRRTLQLDPHGRNIGAVREQLTRLAACDFRMGRSDTDHSVTVQGHILSGLKLWTPQAAHERTLWPTQVQFSQEYFQSLSEHAVPLNEVAVSRLAHSAMGLDLYAWLAQRLHRIERARPSQVSWMSLAQQFGSGYTQLRDFRRVFKRTLAQVKALYPDANFTLESQGMCLAHSRPPVARRLVVVHGR